MKQFLKRLVPEQYWNSLSWWRLHFGAADAVLKHIAMLFRAERLIRVTVEAHGRRTPIWLRPGTTDLDVYEEVFFSREYDLALNSPDLIIDAGGHIGLASVFLALRFPKAEIVVLEPEAANFKLLQRNVGGLRNVRALQAGLWSRRAKLEVVDQNVSTWAFRVQESSNGSGIDALGLVDVLQGIPSNGRLLLKMDIEGSEVEVLSTSEQWLPRVETIVIELHDRFRPGCRQALDDALRPYTFSESRSGESVVVSNLRARVPA